MKLAMQIAGMLIPTFAINLAALKIGVLLERAKWKKKCVDYHRGFKDGQENERSWWIATGKQLAEAPPTRRKP